jgi:hypothetical protein
MITNEQQEHFLSQLDDKLKEFYETSECIKGDKDTIEMCINKFTQVRCGKNLPIHWVKESNFEIKEFYPTELSLTWLVTYITYYNELLKNDPDKELEEMKHACIFLGIALSKIKGINIVDDVVYLLEHDLEFVSYKLDRKLFI